MFFVLSDQLKGGFQPKSMKSTDAPHDMKALLQQDVNQNRDEVSNDEDGVFGSESKFTTVMPHTQRQRPLLARAAKAAPKILKDDDSLDDVG